MMDWGAGGGQKVRGHLVQRPLKAEGVWTPCTEADRQTLLLKRTPKKANACVLYSNSSYTD